MKKMIIWLAALLLLLGISPTVSLAEGDISAKAELNQAGRTIGVNQGSAAEAAVISEFPEATIVYYTDKLLGYTALAQGKLDAYVYDLVQMQLTIDSGLTGVHLLPEVMDKKVQIAVGYSNVSAIPELGDRLNRFIAELKADGTLDNMYRRWVIEKDSVMPEIPKPEKPQFRLTVGTTGNVPPYSYYEGNGLTGYDIELAQRFAAWLGAELSFQIIDFDGVVAAVQSGKVDVVMSNLQYLPERAESMPFSDILYEEKLGILVRGDSDVTLSSLMGWAQAEAGDSKSENEPAYAAYNGKRIGVLTGPLMEDTAHEYFPDSEYLLFNSYPDCITALVSGKIDAYLGDEQGLKTVHAEQPEIDYIHERITENNYSFAFRKNDPESAALCEELNAFLARCWADGTMQELDDIWFGVDEARKVVDMSDLTGENGTVRVVTTSTDAPFSYIKDGKNVGYDIDLVVRFCRDRGYALELGDVDFAGRIPAIESGKYDFTTDMNVTPEREEQVLFSDPTSKGGIVLAVLKAESAPAAAQALDNAAGSAKDSSPLEGIASSFNKTFLREARWKLFAEGVLTTLLITLLTILFGTLLGFGVFMLCRNGNSAANLVTRFCLWLVQGMPMVVLLMILYYVIFGSVAITGVAVAVIGFTLTFGAAVFGLLKMGVGAVDNGQYEAAYALGYSNRRTFFRIILPQALPHVLPAYKGEIVGLIKATAIVGYIAVQDLTKMGDIVRSRTYEAFFPLIAVTVIYFVLEGLIGFLVSRISVSFDPKRRKSADILKGVKTGDSAR